MPLTPYHIACPHPLDQSLTLLFATATGALAVVPTRDYDELARGTALPGWEEALAGTALLVANPAAEERRLYEYLDAMNTVNDRLVVSVILGLACNFDCVYCYEGTMKGDQAMSDATADRLVIFLQERFVVGGNTRLHLDFYGGEPLLYRQRIKGLAAALKPFVEERGGVFDFNLVTNGSLLTAQVVAELVPYGLSHAKVTIDGPAANHDRFRPFKSGVGSFETVVANLLASCQMTKVTLAGNYTVDNHLAFPLLLDHLVDRGLRPDQLAAVNFNIVMQVNDTYGRDDFRGGCGSINEPWLADASLTLREEVLKRGFHVPELCPSPCAVDLVDAFTVNWDGGLTKCSTLIHRSGCGIGDIWQGMEDYGDAYFLNHWQREKKCRQCRYLPLCFGGCRFMAMQRTGGMASLDCIALYYDRALPVMLRQDVAYRHVAT